MSIQIGNTTLATFNQSSKERIILQSALQSNLLHLMTTNSTYESYILYENTYNSNNFFTGKKQDIYVIGNQTSNILLQASSSNIFIQDLDVVRQITSTVTITSNLTISNSKTNDLVLNISSNNIPIITTYTSGNTGIGVFNPQTALHVNKTIRSDTAIQSPIIANVNEFNLANGAYIRVRDTNNISINTPAGAIYIDSPLYANIYYTSNLGFSNLILDNAELFTTYLNVVNDGTGGNGSFPLKTSLLNVQHLSSSNSFGVSANNMVKFKIIYPSSNILRSYNPFQIDSTGKLGIGTVLPQTSVHICYDSNIDLNSNGIFKIQGTGSEDQFQINPSFKIGIGSTNFQHNFGMYISPSPYYIGALSNVSVQFNSNVLNSNVSSIGTNSIATYAPIGNSLYSYNISSNASNIFIGSYTSNAVYVYQGTTLLSTLVPSDVQVGDLFGKSIALSSNAYNIVIGAPGSNQNRGASYVYKWNGITWAQQTKLVPTDLIANSYFGSNVFISQDGNTIAASAHGSNQGAAYVYRWTNNWQQQAKLTSNDGIANLGLNMQMATDGNTIILPCPSSNLNQGAVYAFKYSTFWSSNKFVEPNFVQGNFFGKSVSLSSNGNTFAVTSSYSTTGAIYLYQYTNNNWVFSAPVSTIGSIKYESIVLAQDASSLVVGSPSTNNNKGSVIYWYQSVPNIWLFSQLNASDGAINDRFGTTLAMSPDSSTIIVGAPFKYSSGNSNQGASYLYKVSGSTKIENKLLINGTSNLYFGNGTPIISGNAILIGSLSNVSLFNNTLTQTSNYNYYLAPAILTSNIQVPINVQTFLPSSNAILGVRQYGPSNNIAPYIYASSNDVQILNLDSLGRVTIGSVAPYSSLYSPSYSLQTVDPIITPTVYTRQLLGLPGNNTIDFGNTNLSNVQQLNIQNTITSNITTTNIIANYATINTIALSNLIISSLNLQNLTFQQSLSSGNFLVKPNYVSMDSSNTIMNFTNPSLFVTYGVNGLLQLNNLYTTSTPTLISGNSVRILSAYGLGDTSIRVSTSTGSYALTEYSAITNGVVDTGFNGYIGLCRDGGSIGQPKSMQFGAIASSTLYTLMAYDTSIIYLSLQSKLLTSASSIIQNGNLFIGRNTALTNVGIGTQTINPKLVCNGAFYVGNLGTSAPTTAHAIFATVSDYNPSIPKAQVGINYLPLSSDGNFTVNGDSKFVGGQITIDTTAQLVSYGSNYFVGNTFSTRNIFTLSDSNLKTDIQPITNALFKVDQLTGCTYLRTDTLSRETGLIAQDVLSILPEAVTLNPESNHLSVAYGNMMGLMVQSIKELTQKVNNLETEVIQLRKIVNMHSS